MNRLQQRLADLEKAIAPKVRHFAFICFEEPDMLPRADQLANFKAANGVGPGDIIHTVDVTFS